jgi:hypothetical protein
MKIINFLKVKNNFEKLMDKLTPYIQMKILFYYIVIKLNYLIFSMIYTINIHYVLYKGNFKLFKMFLIFSFSNIKSKMKLKLNNQA